MLLRCNCHNCKIKTTMKQPSRTFLSQLLVPQNFKAVDHVPCTLGCLVTCLVFNFTTFLPNAFLSLVACRCISSGVKFFTQITRSFLFLYKPFKCGCWPRISSVTTSSWGLLALNAGKCDSINALMPLLLPPQSQKPTISFWSCHVPLSAIFATEIHEMRKFRQYNSTNYSFNQLDILWLRK